MRAYLLDLGVIPYSPAFRIQEWVFNACKEKRLPAVVIMQENPPVFTIGRAGSRANILADPAELERLGIDVIEVSRGGDVTYHGPGQLIVSPLLYLGDLGLNANQYMHKLEDIIIALLKDFGILAQKVPEFPGVWVKAAKIGAVGLAVKEGYTLHGFSINYDLDLSPYTLINPCGVRQMPVTSMAQELGKSVTVTEVKKSLVDILSRVLGLELEVPYREIILTPDPSNPYSVEILE
jgi:lipoate-protein ligase B